MPIKASLSDPFLPPPSPAAHDTIPVAHYPLGSDASAPNSPKEVDGSGYTQLPSGPSPTAKPKRPGRTSCWKWPWASLASLSVLLVGVGLLLTAPTPRRAHLVHHLSLVNITGLGDTWKGMSDQAAAALEQWVAYMQAGDTGSAPEGSSGRRVGSMMGWDLPNGGVSTELELLLLVAPAAEAAASLPQVPASSSGQDLQLAADEGPLEGAYDYHTMPTATPATVEDQGNTGVTTASVSLSLADERAVQEVVGDGVIAGISMGGVVTEVRHLTGTAVSATGDTAAPGVPGMNPPVLDELLVTVDLPGDASGESAMSVLIPLDSQLPAEVVTVEVTTTTTVSAAPQAGAVATGPLPAVSVSVDLVREVDQLLVSVEVPGSYLEMTVPTVNQESGDVLLLASTPSEQMPGQPWSTEPSDQLSAPYLALHQSYSQWLLQHARAAAAAASTPLAIPAPDEGQPFDAAATYAHGVFEQQGEVPAGQFEEGAGLLDTYEEDHMSWLGYDEEEYDVDQEARDNEGRLLSTSEQLVRRVVDTAGGAASDADAPQQQGHGPLAVHHRPYRLQSDVVKVDGDLEDSGLVNPVLLTDAQQYMEPSADYLEQFGLEQLDGPLRADDITPYTLEDLAGVSEHLDAPVNFPAGDTLVTDPYSSTKAEEIDEAGDTGGIMAYGAQVPADAIAESISGLFMGRRRMHQAVRPAPASPSPPVVAPAAPKPGPSTKPAPPPPAKVAPSPPPPAKPQSPPPPAKPANLSPPPPPSVILIDPVPPSPPAPSPSVTPATPAAPAPTPGAAGNGTVGLPADPYAPVMVPADTSNTTKTNSTSPDASLVPTDKQAKEVETKLASEAAAAARQEPVTVTMDMRGVLPETFSSVDPSILKVLSDLAGVSDPWSLYGLAPLTTVTSVTPSGRHLLQSPGQVVGVRALYLMNTTSSKLVAFRLAQPLGTAGGVTGGSDTGCRTVLCQQLVTAGVPVDVSSIVVVPDGLAIFSQVQEASDAEAARAAATYLRNTIIAAVVAGVGGLLLLLVAWKLLPGCYRRCLAPKTEAKTLPTVRPHGRRSTNGSDFSFGKGSRVLVVQHSSTSHRSASFALEAVTAPPQQQVVTATAAQTEALPLEDDPGHQQQQVEAVKGTVTNVRPVAAIASARTVYGKMGATSSVSSQNSGARIMSLFAPPVADFEEGEVSGSTCTWSEGPASPVGDTTHVLPTLSPHGTASHLGRAGSGSAPPPGPRNFFTPGPSPTSADGAALNPAFRPAQTVNASGQTSRRTSATAVGLAPATPAGGPTRASSGMAGVSTADFSMRPAPLSPRASGSFSVQQGIPAAPPASAAGGGTGEGAQAAAAGAAAAGACQAAEGGSRASIVHWWLSRN